uniref:Uncharacterized protein n=1 Tax=viral metagenome TaxID=1070528 RepID=A0A6M3XQT5_9ZZZZ
MASSYTVSWQGHGGFYGNEETLEITYAITAHTDGSVTDISTNTDTIKDGRTYTQLIRGKSLKIVEAFPTVGGTAPDAADVTVKDSDGLDMLNGNGVNLIHATNTQSTYPMIDSVPAIYPIRGALTISIANQATASANFTIRLTFVS